MHSFTLTPTSPANSYNTTLRGNTLSEVTGVSIVSAATPNGGEDELNSALKSAFKCDRPKVGMSATSGTMDARIMSLQSDQLFIAFKEDGPTPKLTINELLKGTGYFSDQSDSWIMLRLSGPRSTDVLERICPIDLHPENFSVNALARTTMEHLGTIIVREDEYTFLLLSARSSAASFLHAVETSLENVA